MSLAAPVAVAHHQNDWEAFLAFLVETGELDATRAERVRHAVRQSGEPVDVVITELGLMSQDALLAALSRHLGHALMTADELPLEAPFEGALDSSFLATVKVLPLADDGETVLLASAEPFGEETWKAIGYRLGRRTAIRLMPRGEFEAAFARLYAPETSADDTLPGAASSDDLERLKDAAREAPAIRLVGRIIAEAVEAGASDIHIEPLAEGVRVRQRIDGVLKTMETLAREASAGACTRIKLLSQLDIAERRLPQDGRIRMTVKGRDIDLRVASVPTLHGEALVLRVLDRSKVALDFATLGFEADAINTLHALVRQPNGIVLVSGPTGSGKTTTLYAALKILNSDERKTFTVEDPVEHQLSGLMQIQVRPDIGLSFAASLRAILRQDPDVVMVGEIRETEVGRVAIQAALTGHLVLSTVHTNDAASAVTRLVDMGLESYLLAATLRGVVAQRLVRRPCPDCAAPDTEAESFIAALGCLPDEALADAKPVRAVGCEACRGSGYRGRTTICEIIVMDDALRRLVLAGADEGEISEAARNAGAGSLLQCAAAKVLAGDTTLDEMLRVVHAGG